MNRNSFALLMAFLLAGSCSAPRSAASLDYTDYTINKSRPVDTGMVHFLQPYASSMAAAMNKVIGFTNETLVKKKPESPLGNFLADCMRLMAEKKFEQKVDAGFINDGGIRSYLSKGNVTVGQVFEIMPFDNLVVLQKVKGSTLQLYLDKIASEGGWPVSGLTLQIKNKKATNIVVGGKPFDVNATYVIANSDYIANGGDNCDMLKVVPVQNRGYIMRDAIIDYITIFTQQGKPVGANIENRVTNVD